MESSRRSASSVERALAGALRASFDASLSGASGASLEASLAATSAAAPTAYAAVGLAASGPRWLVAFSGGLDSTVLFHAAVAVAGAGRVVAAHVHHGLQEAADAWPAHCATQARALGVALECVRLESPPPRGSNVEAWARAQRYRALADLCRRVGAFAILTAHHADDQVETMLMRVARGTGIDGLTGIATEATLAGARVLRPLLGLPRAQLLRYAREHHLCWVEDPTNRDLGRTRNAVRHRLLPAIDATLPGFRAQLLATLPALRAARDAHAALAANDLENARRVGGPDRARAVESFDRRARAVESFDRSSLAELDERRRRAALREWIAQLGLRMPTRRRLAEIDRQLLGARGAYGWVEHEGVALTRYRDEIVARRHAGAPESLLEPLEQRWRGEREIALPGRCGTIAIDPVAGGAEPCVGADWLRAQSLRITAGGASSARLRPSAGAPSRTLKNLYQERGVPAWLRASLPLVYAGEGLLYAGGIGMDCSGGRFAGSQGVRLQWKPMPGAHRSDTR